MDFSNGKELLHCCGKHKLPISGITRLREIEIGHVTEEEIDQRLSKVYDIMRARNTTRLRAGIQAMVL